MKWRCDKCGLGPIEVAEHELPVHHFCEPQEVQPASLDCIHRGPVIATHACELCGQRGVEVEVYQCELLDQPCTLRRWENSGKAKRAGEVSCLTCERREG